MQTLSTVDSNFYTWYNVFVEIRQRGKKEGFNMTSKGLEEFRLPRWDDLPSMDLYLEQILELLDEWLGDYLAAKGKRVLTKTMINNYVKLQYLKAPVNKKYDRLSVACLFVIAVLKPIYTIEEISRFIRLALQFESADKVFDRFCDMTEQAVSCAFNRTSMPKAKEEGDPRDLFWNICNSFASQLYVKKIYLQAPADEQLEFSTQ